MQKIIPHLWYSNNAEEAVEFYLSIFKNGSILSSVRYPEAGQEIHGQTPGTVMSVSFQIEDFEFIALNGGPVFTFTPAISFMVSCSTIEEVQVLWEKLSEGGKALMELGEYPFSEQYGWIQDKYGLSWQLIYSAEPSAQKIIPSLLFVGDQAGRAEEAMNFYVSQFEGAKVNTISRYPAGMEPDKEGTVMYGDFTLAGQIFAAMDSAHEHKYTFNEAVSLMVTCEDQAEIDRLWAAMSAVPESEQCGWLKDKFGVSWQIIPDGMDEMLNNPDTEKANKAMAAMLQMKKIDIAELERAGE